MKLDYQDVPDVNHRFFIYDPANYGMMYFATAEERDASAEWVIGQHLDDEWSEEVTNVIAGEITHEATEVNRKDRKDFTIKQWADTVGSENVNWDHTCDYELRPISSLIVTMPSTENPS